MNNSKQTENSRKRKRYEAEYDNCSRRTMPYTINNQITLRNADDFYHRALTCMDLSNLYLQNGHINEALIYLNSAIDDLNRAKNIYQELNLQPEAHKMSALYSEHQINMQNEIIVSQYSLENTDDESSKDDSTSTSSLSTSFTKNKKDLANLRNNHPFINKFESTERLMTLSPKTLQPAERIKTTSSKPANKISEQKVSSYSLFGLFEDSKNENNLVQKETIKAKIQRVN